MKEKDFQSDFNKWIKYVYKKTACFELKITKEKSIAFNSVQPHQIDALLNAKNGTLVYKIPDAGYQNPFDCFSLHKVPAFVVLKFPKDFYVIDVDDFIFERDRADRKSITEERAKEISTFCGADVLVNE